MMLNYRILENKVCLVTGTSRGIGAEIVKCFAQAGAIVYANAKEKGSIDEITMTLSKQYQTKVIPLYFDVVDANACKNAIMQIKKDEKHLDVLVNNAGIMKDALIGMIQNQLIEEIFKVNVFATMELLQLSARLMRSQSSGSIINFASIVGSNGNSGQLVYSASKGAVIALIKTAAKELAAANIRVNAVSPGMIDTDMFRSIGDKHVEKRLNSIGMKRLGTPKEVADLCVYLASDLSSYITGQVIGVDGAATV